MQLATRRHRVRHLVSARVCTHDSVVLRGERGGGCMLSLVKAGLMVKFYAVAWLACWTDAARNCRCLQASTTHCRRIELQE